VTEPIHLTAEELQQITGRIRYSAQLRWLRANGFVYLRRADGMPLVARSHFEAMMSGLSNQKPARTEPNWSALDAPKKAQQGERRPP
jgi:hypothetical protein